MVDALFLARLKGFFRTLPCAIASLTLVTHGLCNRSPKGCNLSCDKAPLFESLQTKNEAATKRLQLRFLARLKGFEPPFFRIGICCVIQLRHKRLFYIMPCKSRALTVLVFISVRVATLPAPSVFTHLFNISFGFPT